MGAIRTMAYASIRRHKVRSLSILFMSFLGAAVTVLTATVAADAHRPWENAFEAAAGPHLVMEFDASLVSKDDIQATASLPNVDALGEIQESVVLIGRSAGEKGPVQVVARTDPGGHVGRLTLVEGRWPQQAGEIAVTPHDDYSPLVLRLGEIVSIPTSDGPAELRIVGVLIDLTATSSAGSIQRGWVLPGGVSSLSGSEAPLRYLAPYRLSEDVSEQGVATAEEAIGAALAPGAQTAEPLRWQFMRDLSNWMVLSLGSIVFGFTTVILVAVVLTISSVIAGTVLASYRDFGVAKALGFTPWQVMGLLMVQVAGPSAVGAAFGMPLGIVASYYFLSSSSAQLGLPVPSPVNPVLDLLVAAGFMLLVAAAAALPGLRAARISAAAAISRGRSPGLGKLARRGSALLRLGLPRAVGLGAAAAVDRPLRALLTIGAVAAGIAALTFAATFNSVMDGYVKDRASWGGVQDITVYRVPGAPGEQAQAVLSSRPEIDFSVQAAHVDYWMAGQSKAVFVLGMQGDSERMGFSAIKGRWFAGPGEAVMDAYTAKERNVKIGDTVTGTIAGGEVRLTVVGLINDGTNRGFRVGWNTLINAAPNALPDTYLLRLKGGADHAAFVDSLNAQAPDQLQATRLGWEADTAPIANILGGLSAIIILLAAVGTFNTTMLAMRERLRDTAVLKVLGMSGRQITTMVITFSAVLTLGAAAVGIPAGLWMQDAIVNGYSPTLGIALDPAALDPRSAGLIMAGALAITLLGAFVPARRARRLPVAAVLRSE